MFRLSCVLAGKNHSLYRHDLLALHSKHQHRFSLPMNKIPEKLVPRLVNFFPLPFRDVWELNNQCDWIKLCLSRKALMLNNMTHAYCLIGYIVWLGILFDWVYCLIGYIVWLGILFDWVYCLIGYISVVHVTRLYRTISSDNFQHGFMSGSKQWIMI